MVFRSGRISLVTRFRRLGFRLLQWIAKRVGHVIVSEAKLKSLIAEIDGIYRATLFPTLLAADETRLEVLRGLIGTSVSEGVHIAAAMARALPVDGAVCEFGVAQGATSVLLAHGLSDTDRELWLFDTFEGLPKPHARDELIDDVLGLGTIEAYEGTMAYGASEVLSRLESAGFPADRIRIVPGLIEEVVVQPGVDLPPVVSFAYVDFDFYSGISTALEMLDGRMQEGGVIIVDDYDFFSAGAKAAVDEFVERHAGRYEFSLPIPEAGKFCVLDRVA